MEDRYTAGLATRVGRDLAKREKYLLAVPLLAAGFTLNVSALAALAAGLGSFAAAASSVPSWAGAASGASVGAVAGVLITRWRQRTAATPLPGGPASMLVLAVTDRRYLIYRRSLGNQARRLLAEFPRREVLSVSVERGTYLRPRPVTIRLRDGGILQFEGARADSVGRLPAAAGGLEGPTR
jgi:hypothetical protein